jgi:glucose/arabinose dehydrogenase/PKD repeat protein
MGRRFLIGSVALVAGGAALAATPPAGFEDRQLVNATSATGASPAVGIAYEPGTGALFVIEQGSGAQFGTARVRRRNPTTGAVTTALTLNCVDSLGERGLLGIAFDPDYLSGSRYVYLYYTRETHDSSSNACHIAGLDGGGYNTISRFQESGGTLSNEQVILRGPILSANNHQGGTLRFGPDKTLYVSMGDNDTDHQSPPAARNLNDLRGKILRINRDGSIPQNNPFVGQAGRREEIWAWGLRNPFRMGFDSQTGKLYIGDVGEATYEEIDEGIAGADYGWPCFEANAAFRSCSPAPSGDVKPIYFYGHNGQTDPVEGDSVIAGPVYRATAFPAAYRGRFYFGDYGGGWIRSAAIAANGSLTDVQMFIPDATGVTDMVVSPAGCLTWVSILGQGVRDACPIGAANGQPSAEATATPTAGLAPLAVQFDGRGSSDPDGDPLTYHWDFDDGSADSTAAAPIKTYAANGIYDAVLTVNDGRGQANSTDTATVRVVVGNRPPVGTIDTPLPGAHYNAGQSVSYSGTALDPEQGALPASAFSWTIVFHHDEHTHPFLGPVNGATSGSFTPPASGEEATNVWYRIHQTVTDTGVPLGSGGAVSSTTYHDVFPNLTTVQVAARPPGHGLQLGIDGTVAAAPWVKGSVVGFPRTLSASNQTAGGITWQFQSWSDGGSATHTVSAPAFPTTYTATFTCTANCGLDGDGDGVPEAVDNCPGEPNANQADFDDDGFGDLCETGALLADWNLSGRVDGIDLAALGRAFGSSSGDPDYDSALDFTRDGAIDGDDLAVLAAAFGTIIVP